MLNRIKSSKGLVIIDVAKYSLGISSKANKIEYIILFALDIFLSRKKAHNGIQRIRALYDGDTGKNNKSELTINVSCFHSGQRFNNIKTQIKIKSNVDIKLNKLTKAGIEIGYCWF